MERLRIAVSESEDPLAMPVSTLMLDTGLRVSELCALDIDDIDKEDLSALVIGERGRRTEPYYSRKTRLMYWNHGSQYGRVGLGKAKT